MHPPYDVVVTTTPTEFDLNGRTALVTGAGSPSGIGFAAARILGSLGARVVMTSTTDRITERVTELSALGIDAHGIVARLESAELVDELSPNFDTAGFLPISSSTTRG